MKAKFWIEDNSPKQFFEAYNKEKPFDSLWEIFTSYQPNYENLDYANQSIEWLEKQKQIIDKIIQNHFSNSQFKRNEIEWLIEAIEEYVLPEEEQFLDDLKSKHKDLAKQITQEIIIPLKLNRYDIYQLIDALEDNLIMQDNLNDNVEAFDNNEIDEDTTETDDFYYPNYTLAYSNTFFGFNGDAGDLSYEEQEKTAQKKFKQYEEEISALLNQKVDTELLPKRLDLQDESDDDAYFELVEKNPFFHEFEGDFSIWQNDNKVLFLSMTKEDKELPYEIKIGGLTLLKYKEVLNVYNQANE